MVHVYVGLRLSSEDIKPKITPNLQSEVQEILTKIHLQGELSFGSMGVVSHTILQPSESTNLVQYYQKMLNALEGLYAKTEDDLPDILRVPMLASTQPLAMDDGVLLWEFANPLILDSPVYDLQSDKEGFELLKWGSNFYIWKSEIDTLQAIQVKKHPEKTLCKMQNIGPDTSPQKISIENVSIEDLPKLAVVAYADVKVTEQIGGRELLLSSSLERNPGMVIGVKSFFTFYNAPALGLKYQVKPNSLADHIQRGEIRVLDAIAGHSIPYKAYFYKVCLKLENLSGKQTTTNIPKGMLFEVIDPMSHVQNMRVQFDNQIQLDPYEQKTTEIECRCANPPFRGPLNTPVRTTPFAASVSLE